MQGSSEAYIGRTSEFFRLGLSHDSLANHYQVNFEMAQRHGYSLTELNEMLPWEREVYVALLTEYIRKENERNRRELDGINR